MICFNFFVKWESQTLNWEVWSDLEFRARYLREHPEVSCLLTGFLEWVSLYIVGITNMKRSLITFYLLLLAFFSISILIIVNIIKSLPWLCASNNSWIAWLVCAQRFCRWYWNSHVPKPKVVIVVTWLIWHAKSRKFEIWKLKLIGVKYWYWFNNK